MAAAFDGQTRLAVNASDLRRLIFAGEGRTIDFKKTITHPHKLAKSLAAFANTEGGYLLIGVMDDRQIIGIDPEEEQHQLARSATEYCQPAVPYEAEVIELEEGPVLSVYVPASEERPHVAFNRRREGKVYVRMHDKCLEASPLTVRSMEAARQKPQPIPLHKLSKHEQALMQYFQHHERITLRAYARLANLSERRAKRSLIDLTQQGVLHEHTLESDQFYTLAV